MSDSRVDDPQPVEDARLPYERPELVDMGKIAEITGSNGNNSGSDSAYS